MNISLYTLGCKLNTAETDDLKRDLFNIGHVIVPYDTNEDISIIRGCGVTCSASQKTRNIIRHINKKHIYVIAVGCIEDKDLAEIDYYAHDNNDIVKHLKTRKIADSPFFEPPIGELDRTRAFVKIQTGCNFDCAYCIIPSFRGKAVSIPPEDIIRKINEAVDEGYKEVVLTGINVCQYRHIRAKKDTKRQGHKAIDDGEQIDLADLLELILEKTKIERIRLGSLDPRLISTKLIGLYQSQFKIKNLKFKIRLLPHWHLSLQSGSDSVLKRMNRNYTAKKYFEIVAKLRKVYPLFSITTDIIVGFPGETEKEFEDTCDFVKKIEFANIHVFPFSPRPNTLAFSMLDQISDSIKKARVKKLIKLDNNVGKDFSKKFVGLERPVLVEHKNVGYTPEFIQIKLTPGKYRQNEIVDVKIKKENL